MTETKVILLDLKKGNYLLWKTHVIGLMLDSSVDGVRQVIDGTLIASEKSEVQAKFEKANVKANAIIFRTIGGEEHRYIDLN
jgi:hypothetical protein